jgi:hypothetical protein
MLRTEAAQLSGSAKFDRGNGLRVHHQTTWILEGTMHNQLPVQPVASTLLMRYISIENEKPPQKLWGGLLYLFSTYNTISVSPTGSLYVSPVIGPAVFRLASARESAQSAAKSNTRGSALKGTRATGPRFKLSADRTTTELQRWDHLERCQ